MISRNVSVRIFNDLDCLDINVIHVSGLGLIKDLH